MITIKDTYGKEFRLYKFIAKDSWTFARKKDIQNSLLNGNLFKLYDSRTRKLTEPVVHVWAIKNSHQIELGCHMFIGRARRKLITWLKS